MEFKLFMFCTTNLFTHLIKMYFLCIASNSYWEYIPDSSSRFLIELFNFLSDNSVISWWASFRIY